MLADDYEVHVITRRYSEPLITGHGGAQKITFHYFDLKPFSSKNHYWKFIKPYYVMWQALILGRVRRLQERYRFAVIHHVTYNNVDVPGFLWCIRDARFIWGPVGGGQVPPSSLKRVFGHRWWRELIRKALKWSARFNPVIKAATARAALVMFANEETQRLIRVPSARTELILETAIDPLPSKPSWRQAAPLVRFLWVSHVFPRKGLLLAIEAFAAALESWSGPAMELTVIGDGVALADAMDRANTLGLAGKVQFLGSMKHAEISGQMAEADVFLFTSVQDTSGNVVLEAMQNGLPVIALNHQGAKSIITMGGGILVNVRQYEDTVDEYAFAIRTLARSPELRQQLGARALEEVEARHTWATKRDKVLELYSYVLPRPA